MPNKFQINVNVDSYLFNKGQFTHKPHYITLHYISDLYSAPTVANNFLRRFRNTIHKI